MIIAPPMNPKTPLDRLQTMIQELEMLNSPMTEASKTASLLAINLTKEARDNQTPEMALDAMEKVTAMLMEAWLTASGADVLSWLEGVSP